jgi:hypothetical protein
MTYLIVSPFYLNLLLLTLTVLIKTLSCITWTSITDVMTIILLHLYSFKISIINFIKIGSLFCE